MTRSVDRCMYMSAIVLLATASVTAQTSRWPIGLSKNTNVIVKIPAAAISLRKVSVWSGAMSYTVVIEQIAPQRYSVAGDANWQDSGWPAQIQMGINKAERKKGYTQVELDDNSGNHLKLQFMPSVTDVNAALLAVVHPGFLDDFQKSEYYQVEVIQRLLPRVFTGPLAAIPGDVQLQMIKGASYDLNAIAGETYKGRFYITIRSQGITVYNTLQVNQPSRIARTIEAEVLPSIKVVSAFLKTIGGIDGLKIDMKVFYKNFVREYEAGYDHLQLYIPLDAIKRLAADEITSQQFINESVALVNNTRVEISLTQFH